MGLPTSGTCDQAEMFEGAQDGLALGTPSSAATAASSVLPSSIAGILGRTLGCCQSAPPLAQARLAGTPPTNRSVGLA